MWKLSERDLSTISSPLGWRQENLSGGPPDDRHRDLFRATAQQNPAAVFHCRAGGHDIINEQDIKAINPFGKAECTGQIRFPLTSAQLMLRRGLPRF